MKRSYPRSVVVLLSGGIDSVTALHAAARGSRVSLGLSFDYGARHNARELPFAIRHCENLGVPHRLVRFDLDALGFRSSLLLSGAPVPDGHYEDDVMRDTVVPFRNAILLAVATGVAESIGAEGVTIGAHGGDHAVYPDCRPPFMRAMADAMRLGTYAGIVLQRPFLRWDKARIVAYGQSLGVDYASTWSCYKGGDIHCGVCGTCVERREAFERAGVPDPTEYRRK